jgi:hypothetical protein
VLAVDADLHAESAGVRMHLGGSGGVLTCRIEGDAARVIPALRQSARMLALVRVSAPLLERAGIRLDVMVGERRVAQAGNGVRQNAVARLLRLPAVRIGA